MVAFTRRKVLSSLAASLGAVAAGASQLGGAGTATAADEMPGMDHDASAAGAAHSGHADFPRGGVVDHAANGFDPHEIVRDFDWGTTRSCADGRALREWELVAVDKEIEVAPGVTFAAWTYNGRIPGPDAALPRGRAAADHVRQRLRAPAHDPLPRHPPGRDGRRARARRRARSSPAAAPSTSSTRCPPGCTSTTATSGRSPSTSPRASTARSSSTRRTAARTPTSS